MGLKKSGFQGTLTIRTDDYELCPEKSNSKLQIDECVVVIANDVKIRNVHFKNKVVIDSSKFVSIGNCIFDCELEIANSKKVVVKDSILKNVVINDSYKILIGNNFVDNINCEGSQNEPNDRKAIITTASAVSKVIIVNCVVKNKIISNDECMLTIVNNLIKEGIVCEKGCVIGNYSPNGKLIKGVNNCDFLLPDSIQPLPVYLLQPLLNKNINK